MHAYRWPGAGGHNLVPGRIFVNGTSTSSPANRLLMANKTLTKDSENGRAPMTASCALRTFAAATSFIASVIFFVLPTDAMRSRISFGLALRIYESS